MFFLRNSILFFRNSDRLNRINVFFYHRTNGFYFFQSFASFQQNRKQNRRLRSMTKQYKTRELLTHARNVLIEQKYNRCLRRTQKQYKTRKLPTEARNVLIEQKYYRRLRSTTKQYKTRELPTKHAMSDWTEILPEISHRIVQRNVLYTDTIVLEYSCYIP